MSLVVIYGTRPEAIKLGPVVAELRHLGIQPHLLASGQHWDLLKGTPAETDLQDSESLGLSANGHPDRWVKGAVRQLKVRLRSLAPAYVIVQGDTASALAGALAAHDMEIPLIHIEAGVRSGNLQEPYPEEGYRREITQLAEWHYAPTPRCVENLLTEGISQDRIVMTGNPVVSALHRYADLTPQDPEALIVLTMHRREWLCTTDLSTFLSTLKAGCQHHPAFTVLWPVHPAVRAKWPPLFLPPRNLSLVPPMPYERMIPTLIKAWGLATDSGGLVEEATTLGLPTAILRNSNDRPEAIEAGTARQFSPTDLESAFAWLTQDHGPRKPSHTYGTPDAASRIAKHLASCT